jgi:hypothetical protein
MSDPIVITAIIAGVGSLILSIISHVKYSECWGAKITMTAQNITPTTPTPNATLVLPTETTPIVSDPIPIPQSIAPVVNSFTPPRQTTC